MNSDFPMELVQDSVWWCVIVCFQGDDKQDSSHGDNNPGARNPGSRHLPEVY